MLTLWAGAWNVQTYRPAFAIRLAHVWTLRDGKILWFYNYVDTAALLAAIGVGSNSVRGDD